MRRESGSEVSLVVQGDRERQADRPAGSVLSLSKMSLDLLCVVKKWPIGGVIPPNAQSQKLGRGSTHYLFIKRSPAISASPSIHPALPIVS